MSSDRLTIAVPRGNLFADTLDVLDRLGIDTSEVRANDRKLLFEDAGIVTMRPSDVPTYVEHGAADIGHRRKGRPHRAVGPRRVRAARPRLRRRAAWSSRRARATISLDESLRRLGAARIATKYPRTAAAYFAGDRPPRARSSR